MCSPGFWSVLSGIGTVASAAVLIWYTILTSRLVKLSKAAQEPFVTLTFDTSEPALYLRNLGAGPARDITVTVEDAVPDLPATTLLSRSYYRQALSPGGHTVLTHLVGRSDFTGRRFRIAYRDKAGSRHTLEPPLIGDPNITGGFRDDYPED